MRAELWHPEGRHLRLSDDDVLALARHVLRDATRSYIVPRELSWLVSDWLAQRHGPLWFSPRGMQAALSRRSILPEQHHGRPPVYSVAAVLATTPHPQVRVALRPRHRVRQAPPLFFYPLPTRHEVTADA